MSLGRRLIAGSVAVAGLALLIPGAVRSREDSASLPYAFQAVGRHVPVYQPRVAAAQLRWCGNGETPDNRLPQLELPFSSTIRVLYAYPADAPDRFQEVADLITSDVAAIDQWWKLQDSAREPRWDIYPFPGCEGGVASLDLGVLPLSYETAYYAASSGFERLEREIVTHFGETEKALVYFDGTVIDPRVCGVSEMAPRNGGQYGVSLVSLQSGCRVDLGAGAATARVAVHELVHGLGAVPSKAPNRCGDSSLGGHACDSPNDLMFPYASAEMRLVDAILDVNRDDYYDHSGDWWDVRDSAWLIHLPRRTLIVSVTGPGSVSSAPAVITCPTTCTVVLDDDFSVRLTALAEQGAEFYGWKGACTGESACGLTMTSDVSVSATFGAPRPALTVRVRGKGRLRSTPSGISCPGRCSAKFPPRSAVTVHAAPAAGWKFARWSSACGARATCSLRLAADRQIVATFVRKTKA